MLGAEGPDAPVLLTFKEFAVRKDFLMVSRRRQRLVARLRV